MRTFLQNTTKQNTSGGFTIVEVLVALTIFSIAVAGVITAAVQGGINVNAARNRMSATYLAQEGIELMRAKRDSYTISAATYDAGWNAFVTDAAAACSTSGPCDLDVADISTPIPGASASYGFRFLPCSGSCVLNYDSSSLPHGYYSHDSTGTPSQFSRRITVVVLSSNKEIQVTSTVTWSEGGSTQTVSESESLFDWYGSS